MKKLILFATLFAMTLTASAQVKFGLKAGISTSDLSGQDAIQDNLTVKLKNADYGMHFGAFLRAEGGLFFIQPEVTFNSLTANYEVDNFSSKDVFKEKYSNLDIPVLVGLKLGPLRAGAGPVGHINIGKESNLAADGIVVSENYEKLTFGYQAGLGLDIWRLNFDLRYEGNFNKVGDNLEVGGTQLNLSKNASRLLFSVGFTF